MYLEPQGDSVTLSAPAFSAQSRGPPFPGAHRCRVPRRLPGCSVTGSLQVRSGRPGPPHAEAARHTEASGPGRGPACSRSTRRVAGATGARHSPLTRPTAALMPAPQPRGPAPDHSLFPANRPALPRSPGRPSPFTCSIAWPGTPLNRIRPLRVPNRTRRLLEPTRSCRDPRVTAPSSPADWLSASRRLCAPLLLV